MRDSTRDKNCKSPQYVQKKSQYSICQQQKRRKKVKLKLFSPYTHIIAQKYFQS